MEGVKVCEGCGKTVSQPGPAMPLDMMHRFISTDDGEISVVEVPQSLRIGTLQAERMHHIKATYKCGACKRIAIREKRAAMSEQIKMAKARDDSIPLAKIVARKVQSESQRLNGISCVTKLAWANYNIMTENMTDEFAPVIRQEGF